MDEPPAAEVVDAVSSLVAQISEYTTAAGRPIDTVSYPTALDDYLKQSQDSRLRRFNSEMKMLYQAASSHPLEDLITAYRGTKQVRNLWGVPYQYLCFSKLPLRTHKITNGKLNKNRSIARRIFNLKKRPMV